MSDSPQNPPVGQPGQYQWYLDNLAWVDPNIAEFAKGRSLAQLWQDIAKPSVICYLISHSFVSLGESKLTPFSVRVFVGDVLGLVLRATQTCPVLHPAAKLCITRLQNTEDTCESRALLRAAGELAKTSYDKLVSDEADISVEAIAVLSDLCRLAGLNRYHEFDETLSSLVHRLDVLRAYQLISATTMTGDAKTAFLNQVGQDTVDLCVSLRKLVPFEAIEANIWDDSADL